MRSVLIDKIDKIIALKKSDSSADIRDIESEIDQLVYDFYGLTPEEIRIVEGGEAGE